MMLASGWLHAKRRWEATTVPQAVTSRYVYYWACWDVKLSIEGMDTGQRQHGVGIMQHRMTDIGRAVLADQERRCPMLTRPEIALVRQKPSDQRSR